MVTSTDGETTAGRHELAAIMFSDIAGYTAIMGRDEESAVRALDEHRGTLRSLLPKFHGRLVGEVGDGTLSSFHSAIDAVNCARQVQAIAAGNPELKLRIGIHLGDVVFANNTVIGDGVNVASGIHALAAPGAICVSAGVYDEIRNKPGINARALGEKKLKNLSRPVRVYVLAREPDVGHSVWIGKPKRWAVVTVGAGALTAGFVIYFGVVRKTAQPYLGQVATAPHAIKSIAVLPLDNFSGDPNQEYFADGMTDELTTDLAKISALRVISRGSVMRFKGANRPPTPEIAKVLNVDAIVEGSVLRSGDKVRITAQLIDAPADKHMWADSFERDSRDVLVLQDELASAIAQQIEVQLTPGERERLTRSVSVNPAAHNAYLKGRYYLADPSPERVDKGIEQFKQAIRLDPGFALPYSGLADAYSWADDLYSAPLDVMPQAKAAAERALELDASLPEAHVSQAYVNMQYDYDFEAAASQFERAIELGPNYADAHAAYAWLLGLEGRSDKAILEAKRAIDLDPLSSGNAQLASFAFIYSGRYDTATAIIRQAIDFDPTSDILQFQLGYIELASGHPRPAIVELEKARRTEATPYVAGWLGYAYAASGDRKKALAAIRELDEASIRGYVSPFSAALIYLALGDKDRAVAGLEKAYEVRSMFLVMLKMDRLFDPLRSEPRFIALMTKMNFQK